MITNSIKEKLQCGAEDAMDRSRQNIMHINYDKTNHMLLGRTNKQNVPQEFDIRIDDKHIKKTQKKQKKHKLLGIHIDDKLSWSSHGPYRPFMFLNFIEDIFTKTVIKICFN